MTQLDTETALAQPVRVTQIRTFPIPGEATLAPGVRSVLQQIGAALDEHQRLRVYIHGVVALDHECATAISAKEKGYDGQGKRGSATRPRQRAARWKGPPSGSRPTGPAPRISGSVLRNAYEGQMIRLAEAYPTLRVFADDNGMWLLARSSIISGLPWEATFLVALPHVPGVGPRAWGFWTAAESVPSWIGPRHTNFQDGSICAFAPNEGAWSEGEDLRTLFDLYSVWALRHLHLMFLGRWPGKQYAFLGVHPAAEAYYRQRECQDDELCGCGSETRRYAECCKSSDLRWSFVESATLFLQHTKGGFESRRVPPSVLDFVQGRLPPPKIADVHVNWPRCDEAAAQESGK